MVTLFKLRKLLFLMGVTIIGVNIIGFFLPLRNPDIYREKSDDISLTAEQLLEIVSKRDSSDEDFILKVNRAVNQGMAHYWRKEGIDKYYLRIPVYENYLLFCASFIYPRFFERYQFCDYKKAIKRGVGLCSQHAIIVSEILEENDIDTKVIDLGSHVVLSAQVNKLKDVWYVLDPDIGVVIKHSLEEIEENPELIRGFYKCKEYLDLDWYVNIYKKEGNLVWDSAYEYLKELFFIEYLSYIGKWIIPFLLCFPMLFMTRNY